MTIPIYKPGAISKSIKPSALLPFAVERAFEGWIAEPKLDGSRYLLYFGYAHSVLLSRRVSEVTGNYVDKTENCPHLTSPCPELVGTVLDGEIVFGANSSETITIMGCSPSKAIERQKKAGWVVYNVFDVLSFKGVDITDLPLWRRKSELDKVFGFLNPKYFKKVSWVGLSSAVPLYEELTSKGGEGIVLKDFNSPYGKRWIKVKKTLTLDVIIIGFKQGAGKYTGQVGSIVMGLLKGTKIIEVGTCSGFDDDLRLKLTEGPTLIHHVIEVECQEVTKKVT